MESLIGSLKSNKVTKRKRYSIYMDVIPAFQSLDWDTEMESVGEDPAFDQALSEISPEFFEEDYEY